jgi:large conductance mechanosensitive channel
VLQGFKNFLLRGDVVVIAIGLIVATAFSTLIKSFTTNVINPIIAAAQGGVPKGPGLGFTIRSSNPASFVNIGQFISDIVYFIVFMAVVYFVIVQPYKTVSARRGVVVFGPPAPVKTCPACLSDDLAPAATKCKYCGSDVAVV